jgi:hypothetical protein
VRTPPAPRGRHIPEFIEKSIFENAVKKLEEDLFLIVVNQTLFYIGYDKESPASVVRE